ncbi:MAG: hypothetical protein JXQ85_10085 [Cognatishimia sp.]|uniref:hypothetical protein n=1 Tax=Cognatishimia sp. TaxID=2211648 RepID=UPI003B8DB125
MSLQASLRTAVFVAITSVLVACTTPPPQVERSRVDELSQAIQALSPMVSVEEAERAAAIAYDYPLTLAERYEITDPPLVHNTKVNMGVRPRGLCYHWADDMELRLAQEGFETLDLHRAIANFETPLLLEHSTLILSAMGDDMFQGIVFDPWRKGGQLVWVATLDDPRYDWHPRAEVFAFKRKKRESTDQ